MEPELNKKHEESNKHEKNDILKYWIFKIHEISNGYFRVEGFDQLGHSVSRDGLDREKVLYECKMDVLDMFSKK